jgi:hypothetical protein
MALKERALEKTTPLTAKPAVTSRPTPSSPSSRRSDMATNSSRPPPLERRSGGDRARRASRGWTASASCGMARENPLRGESAGSRLRRLLLARRATLPAFRLWRQPGGLARTVGVGKGFDADDPAIADGQER